MKSGFVAIVGNPNVGKSSLMNALLGEDLSIVTPKPQTTRRRVLGVLTEAGKYQIVFVDTPGIVSDESLKGKLNKFLMSEVEEALKDVDVVVCAVSPDEVADQSYERILDVARKFNKPVIPVVTKADQALTGLPQHMLSTSSLKNTGLEDLRCQIVDKLKDGPAYYDDSIYTPHSVRELSAEIIRKHCFELLHQEIPYGLAVLIQKFKEGPVTEIFAEIVVSKENHKAIVLGRGGGVIKAIGIEARKALEKLVGGKVFLKLFVKVKRDWQKDDHSLKEFGYSQ